MTNRENHLKSSRGVKGKVTPLIFTSMILTTLCPEDLHRSGAAAWKIAPGKVDGLASHLCRMMSNWEFRDLTSCSAMNKQILLHSDGYCIPPQDILCQ